jgi:hypothetical protein
MQSLRCLTSRLYSTVPKSQIPNIITRHNSLHVSLILHNPNKKDFVNLHKVLFDSTRINENKLYYVLDSSKYIHYSSCRLENIILTKILSDAEYEEKTFQEYTHRK